MPIFKNKKKFAKCPPLGTRQNLTAGGRRHGPTTFCRVGLLLSVAALGKAPICREPGFVKCLALGKVTFVECFITRQNISLPSAPIKSTRQSLRHSAKYSFSVVNRGASCTVGRRNFRVWIASHCKPIPLSLILLLLCVWLINGIILSISIIYLVNT